MVACERCGSAGYFLYDVGPEHPLWQQLQACDCTKARWALERQATLEQRSGLLGLAGLAHCTLDSYSPESKGGKAALKRLRTFAQQPEGWIYLQGPTRVGKTHLAVALVRELLARDQESLFLPAVNLLRLLRGGQGDEFNGIFDELALAPVLALDDLGAHHSTGWVDEQLYGVFNDRYNRSLPTVVTSNLLPDELSPRLAARLRGPHVQEIVIDR